MNNQKQQPDFNNYEYYEQPTGKWWPCMMELSAYKLQRFKIRLKQPDKVVESVPVKSADETVEQAAKRLQVESYAPYKVTGDYKLYNFYKGFIKGIEYASQLQNNNAISVIEERIKEFKVSSDPSKSIYGVQILTDILKLLKA